MDWSMVMCSVAVVQRAAQALLVHVVPDGRSVHGIVLLGRTWLQAARDGASGWLPGRDVLAAQILRAAAVAATAAERQRLDVVAVR